MSVGEFGSFMQVHIQNDGPVTIPIESPASWSSVKKGRVCNQMHYANECKEIFYIE